MPPPLSEARGAAGYRTTCGCRIPFSLEPIVGNHCSPVVRADRIDLGFC